MSTVLPANPAVRKGASLQQCPNEIVILFEWDSLEKARKFAQSEDLRKTMQRAGVIDKPDLYFLDEVETFHV